MKNKLLMRTNVILCIVIMMGFVIETSMNYTNNINAFRSNIENISELTSESIYYQINSYFTKPVSVSLTMSNDSLLKSFLSEEIDNMDDSEFLSRIQGYLNAYKDQYGYDTVFLVSAQTNRYYLHSGLDRIITPDDPKNQWYYDFLNSSDSYTLNINKGEPEAAENTAMTFINCKIFDENGSILGVVGIGLHNDNLQELLLRHKQQYGIRTMIIDDTETAAISSEYEADYLDSGLFNGFKYINITNLEDILDETLKDPKSFWVEISKGDSHIASRYIPEIKWYMILENDSIEVETQFRNQILLGVGAATIIVLSVLFIVNKLVFAYNDHLLKQVVSQEMEYHSMIKKATQNMYCDVFEFNVTKGIAIGDETQKYFKGLGVYEDECYTKAMEIVAEQQIKDEYRKAFIDITARNYLIDTYSSGVRELLHESMMNTYWDDYHWVKIRIVLFFWNADQSLRMILFIQDINDEKQREKRLLQDSLTDPLTGLYNRRFMEKQLTKLVKSLSRTNNVLSVLMIDIDFFKNYNDVYGHAEGDICIKEVAEILKTSINREDDYIARYGGEEFIAILPNTDEKGARLIAERILQRVTMKAIPHKSSRAANHVTVSIGGVSGIPERNFNVRNYIECADKALYTSKSNGRNCYSVEPLKK